MSWSIGSPVASRPASRTRRRDDEAGFTLIEILVAFTIATLLLGALLQLFSTGLGAVGSAANQIEAALLAESTLEQVGTTEPLQDGVDDRRAVEGYVVRVTVRRRDDLLPPGPLGPPLLAYGVGVAVSWSEGLRRRSVVLETVRLGSPR